MLIKSSEIGSSNCFDVGIMNTVSNPFHFDLRKIMCLYFKFYGMYVLKFTLTYSIHAKNIFAFGPLMVINLRVAPGDTISTLSISVP